MAEALTPPSAAQKKTFASVFFELRKKFNLVAVYNNVERDQVNVQMKLFYMSLTVETFGISVLGVGIGKQKAKHDAALKMMLQIRKTYRDGDTLNDVPRETLGSYCEWLERYLDAEIQPEPIHIPPPPLDHVGILQDWLVTAVPMYEYCGTFGIDQGHIWTCSHDEHLTFGHGKKKKEAKRMAAIKMLEVLKAEADYY